MDAASLMQREAGLEEKLSALNAEVTQDVSRLLKDPLANIDLVLDYPLLEKAIFLAVLGRARHLSFVNSTAANNAANAILRI